MRHKIGEEGVLARLLPTTCGCGTLIPAGTKITIVGPSKHSVKAPQQGKPRIVMVKANGGLHNVKSSKIWFEGEVL